MEAEERHRESTLCSVNGDIFNFLGNSGISAHQSDSHLNLCQSGDSNRQSFIPSTPNVDMDGFLTPEIPPDHSKSRSYRGLYTSSNQNLSHDQDTSEHFKPSSSYADYNLHSSENNSSIPPLSDCLDATPLTPQSRCVNGPLNSGIDTDAEDINLMIDESGDAGNSFCRGQFESSVVTGLNVSDIMKELDRQSEIVNGQWCEIFRDAEEFELLCPQRLDKILTAAKALEVNMTQQKEALRHRLQILSHTLKM